MATLISPYPARPSPFYSLVGNLMLDWGTMIAFVGVHRFLNAPRPALWLLLPAAVLSCAKIGTFAGFGLHMPINVVLGCSLRALLAGGCAWLLVRHSEPELRIAAWPSAGFYLAWGAVLLTRVGWEVLRILPSSPMVVGDLRDPTTNAGLLLRVCITFTLTIGYLWMVGRRLQARLTRLAESDPLTGIANRRVLWEKGERLVARAQYQGGALAVLLVDIDHFKAVNDRWGHGVGDRLIVQVAGTLAATIRASDIVGRIGGEEFAILLPDADAATALAVAERIRQAVAESAVGGPLGPIGCTISIGCAEWVDGVGWNTLVNAADQALYRAKAAGRDRVESFVLGDEAECRMGAAPVPMARAAVRSA
ncbi:GGDEF domain-containing protein [Nitrospirillum iridis]|uniref:diguanylate cyclase n=1 Tax=Nitrospirillum iridis TaxID=765888 RepID=A0A7X0EEW0_9PROT|nr:GGDEF domain-containing protein [Nitrospirillum iridis]MBB6254322.1 diguanylate cyclase (GGDEF)-like protein [Nitrospirillum iridis]